MRNDTQPHPPYICAIIPITAGTCQVIAPRKTPVILPCSGIARERPSVPRGPPQRRRARRGTARACVLDKERLAGTRCFCQGLDARQGPAKWHERMHFAGKVWVALLALSVLRGQCCGGRPNLSAQIVPRDRPCRPRSAGASPWRRVSFPGPAPVSPVPSPRALGRLSCSLRTRFSASQGPFTNVSPCLNCPLTPLPDPAWYLDTWKRRGSTPSRP